MSICFVCTYQNDAICKHECYTACYCKYKWGDKLPNYPVPAKDMITTGADWPVVIEAMCTYPLELNDYY